MLEDAFEEVEGVGLAPGELVRPVLVYTIELMDGDGEKAVTLGDRDKLPMLVMALMLVIATALELEVDAGIAEDTEAVEAEGAGDDDDKARFAITAFLSFILNRASRPSNRPTISLQ